MGKQTALTMPSIRIKRKIVRSVIAHAVIESTLFYEGVQRGDYSPLNQL
jgi:hypothetical protein